MLGGRGNFGARVCKALRTDAALEVLSAGRDRSNDLQIDCAAADLACRLRAASPSVVVHCAGPFQGQGYEVPHSALAAGAHYLDLADGREFVAGFAAAIDPYARQAGRLALSGASTLPALSSAVADQLAQKFSRIDEIQVAIAPGQRAPRGAATVGAVLGYCGRPFKWLEDGVWRDAWGWQELRRLRFAGAGTRWAAGCDVPDLQLFPERYPGVRTVQFRAALEFGIQHFALWLAAGARRRGVQLPIERWGQPLERIASKLGRFGGATGAMLVAVAGLRRDGRRASAEWHLTVDACTGPEIPCLAAVLLARRLAKNASTEVGAFPCMGFLNIADFQADFSRLGIRTCIEEDAL